MTVFSYLGRNLTDYWEFHVTKVPFLYHCCNKSKKILLLKNLSTPHFRKYVEYVPFYVNLLTILQLTFKRLSGLSFNQIIIIPKQHHFY